MFYGLENTQPEVAVQLETLISEKNFPSCMLFAGPSCSGKMYAAIACSKAFEADLSSTVIISDRNHKYRILSAVKLLEKARNKVAKEFLAETVSTFLKQYHGALLDSQSSSNKKRFSDAASCAEILDEIQTCSENEVLSLSEKLQKAVLPLIDQNKTSQIGVNQIRAIRDWAMESTIDGKPKFVLIEGLENSTDSASNALLKILEEPPEDTFFILLSSNPGRIPATILSRVRKFRFNGFTEKENSYFFNRLFINPKAYEDLQSFFVSYSGVDDALLKDCARALVTKSEFDYQKLVNELESTQAWERFYNLVVKALRQRALLAVDTRRYEFLADEINTIVSKGKAFNQTNRMTLDFVVYRTSEVLK